MKWIKLLLARLSKKQVNYPKQVLDKKILDILDALDSYLTEHSTTMPSESVMAIKAYKIGIFSTVSSVSKLVDMLKNSMPSGFVYVSRSISFNQEADGTWCFRVAFREQGEMDIDKCEMFIDMLARTNDARTK